MNPLFFLAAGVIASLFLASGCAVSTDCGPIRGSVVDAATGKPISQARVTAEYPTGKTATARTTDRGDFQLPKHIDYVPLFLNVMLRNGLSKITVEAKGYSTVVFIRCAAEEGVAIFALYDPQTGAIVDREHKDALKARLVDNGFDFQPIKLRQ